MRGIAGIGDRLKRARQALGLTQGEIAEKVGAKQRSWQEYEAEHSTPGSHVIAGMARLGFNTNWILTGQGSMAGVQQPLSASMIAEAYGGYESSGRADQAIIQAADSTGAVVAVAFRLSWLEQQGQPPQALSHLIMQDDSMEPTIRQGALVVADNRITTCERAGLYIVQQFGIQRDHTWLTVIRASPDPLSGRPVYGFDNKDYSPGFGEHETPDPMWRSEIVGRVIWVGNPIP